MKNYWLDKNTWETFKPVFVSGDVVLDTSLCISNTALPEGTYSLGVDVSNTVLGEDAIMQVDPDYKDVSYIREINLGPFIFKDAGELGCDLFYNGQRLGWLNYSGEKALVNWLQEKCKKNEESELAFLREKIHDKFYDLTSESESEVKYDGKASWSAGD